MYTLTYTTALNRPDATLNQLAAVYRGRGRNEAYLEFAKGVEEL